MNARERSICARIKLFREHLEWTQRAMASAVGISRIKIACIEDGHTPLSYKTGVDLCWAFDINAEWLMTGKGEMHGAAPGLWVTEFPLETYTKKLFSEVFDLKPRVFMRVIRVFGLNEGPTPGFDAETFLRGKIVQWFQEFKFSTPLDAERFARAVNDHAEEMLQKIQHRGVVAPKRIGPTIAGSPTDKGSLFQKSHLTGTSEFRNFTADMKLARTMRQLLQDARRITKPAGMKAALAKYLGVPQSRVSEWLAEKYKPSGEITLRLNRWVYDPRERQK